MRAANDPTRGWGVDNERKLAAGIGTVRAVAHAAAKGVPSYTTPGCAPMCALVAAF